MRGLTWYMRLGSPSAPTGVAQISDTIRMSHQRRGDTIDLPEHVLRLAHAEYEHQQGRSQDYERMQERGGLSVLEVVALLADLAERHGAQPTKPRAAPP